MLTRANTILYSFYWISHLAQTKKEMTQMEAWISKKNPADRQLNGVKVKRSLAQIIKHGQVTRQFDGIKMKKKLAHAMKEMTQVEIRISKKDPEVPRQSNGQIPRHYFDGIKVKKELAHAMKVEIEISKKDPEVPRQSNRQVPRHLNDVCHLNGVKIQLSGAGAGQEMKKKIWRDGGQTTDPIPQLKKDETLIHSPNIQRRHAQRNTDANRIGEKVQKLRGESHGSRQRTKQQAIPVTHGRNNGHE